MSASVRLRQNSSLRQTLETGQEPPVVGPYLAGGGEHFVEEVFWLIVGEESVHDVLETQGWKLPVTAEPGHRRRSGEHQGTTFRPEKLS